MWRDRSLGVARLGQEKDLVSVEAELSFRPAEAEVCPARSKRQTLIKCLSVIITANSGPVHQTPEWSVLFMWRLI